MKRIAIRPRLFTLAVATIATLPMLAAGPAGAVATPSGGQPTSVTESRPDLVVSRFWYGHYVTVRNQGAGPAGASWVKVDAQGFAPEYYRVPALINGASYTINLPFRDWCYGGTSLRTAARADVYSQVVEYSETNNRIAITEVC